jgi:hypothetical protein
MMKNLIANFLAKAVALAFALTVAVVTVYRAQTRAMAAEPVAQQQAETQQPDVLLQSTKDAVIDFVAEEKDPVLLQSTKILILDGHVSGAHDLLNTSKSGIVHPVKVDDVDQLFLGSSKSDSVTFLPTSKSSDLTPVDVGDIVITDDTKRTRLNEAREKLPQTIRAPKQEKERVFIQSSKLGVLKVLDRLPAKPGTPVRKVDIRGLPEFRRDADEPVFLHTSKSAAPIGLIEKKKPAEQKVDSPTGQAHGGLEKDEKRQQPVLFKSSKSGKIRIIEPEKKSK